MGLIDEFVKDIESNYNAKVVDYNYGPFDGWNPLILKLNQSDLLKFISKFNYSGNWKSVHYQVNGNEIAFRSTIGNEILSML